MKYTLEQLIEHTEQSLLNSDANVSKLTQQILNLEGYSGNKTRHFYNNICSLEDANYLEVGTWKGSSFISAIYKNKIKPVAVDNWSEFNGPKEEFFSNVSKFAPESKYDFIEKDSFQINRSDFPESINEIDIYLYDGCHTYDCQKNGITHFYEFFSKYFIIMVDDWRDDDSWKQVLKGTWDGINEKGIIVHKHYERTSFQERTGRQDYWNGIGIFICEKK
jgi:hypothetical protein